MPPSALKPVVWLGDSLQALKAFPAAVQDEVGYALTSLSGAGSMCRRSR